MVQPGGCKVRKQKQQQNKKQNKQIKQTNKQKQLIKGNKKY